MRLVVIDLEETMTGRDREFSPELSIANRDSARQALELLPIVRPKKRQRPTYV
jgi:hypothetical protein